MAAHAAIIYCPAIPSLTGTPCWNITPEMYHTRFKIIIPKSSINRHVRIIEQITSFKSLRIQTVVIAPKLTFSVNESHKLLAELFRDVVRTAQHKGKGWRHLLEMFHSIEDKLITYEGLCLHRVTAKNQYVLSKFNRVSIRTMGEKTCFQFGN
jgi:ribosome maturation protein Sdo1